MECRQISRLNNLKKKLYAAILLYAPVPSSAAASAPARWNERSAVSRRSDRKTFMIQVLLPRRSSEECRLDIRGGGCVRLQSPVSTIPASPPWVGCHAEPASTVTSRRQIDRSSVYLGQSRQRRLVLSRGITVNIDSWVVHCRKLD